MVVLRRDCLIYTQATETPVPKQQGLSDCIYDTHDVIGCPHPLTGWWALRGRAFRTVSLIKDNSLYSKVPVALANTSPNSPSLRNRGAHGTPSV